MDSEVRRSLVPFVIFLVAVVSRGVFVDSVSVNVINELGQPFAYVCEVPNSVDAIGDPLAGAVRDSQKLTIYVGVEGSRSCNFWFEDWDSGDSYQLEFHVCHYHVDDPDDVYEWTFRKTGIFLSESDFKHHWRITESHQKCAWCSD